jgi:hypothetical protein
VFWGQRVVTHRKVVGAEVVRSGLCVSRASENNTDL